MSVITDNAPPFTEATIVAVFGALLLVAGVVAAAWAAAIAGLLVAAAGLTVRALAVFKAASGRAHRTHRG